MLKLNAIPMNCCKPAPKNNNLSDWSSQIMTSYVLYPNLCSIVFVIPYNNHKLMPLEYNRIALFLMHMNTNDNTPIQAKFILK